MEDGEHTSGVSNASLVNHSHVIRGPIDERCLAINQPAIDRAKVAAVAGNQAVISHNEIFVLRQDRLRIGAIVSKAHRDIGLSQGFTVHVDLPVVNAQSITGDGDHPLDIALCRIERKVKNHDIVAMDRLKVVFELVDEEPFLVLQSGHHAGPFHTHRLIQERNDQERNGDGKQQITRPC